ncbi:MAG: hypothetical protein EBT51_12295 [Flavobacteriaceae bacterium]|nr:hypothetical protein [Flavobacteriaceae bacterium]
MIDDDYWSHIVPQSRYRKLGDDADPRPIPMDVVSWAACSAADKQALNMRIDALYAAILQELIVDETAASSVHSDSILSAIKKKLGL